MSVVAVDSKLAAELVALRHDLHAHPELSWQERRTTAALADLLAAHGLTPRVRSDGVGLVCDVPVGSPGRSGPVVAVRGDIDALPVPDAKDVPYRSTVPGVCHACGHDVHAVAAAGAALALHRSSPAGLDGTVRVVLQPAEETLPSGAATLAAEGAVDGCSAALAVHCDPSLPVGRVGLSPGPLTSAYDLLRIVVTGPGGHTARPHLSVDVVTVAARLVTEVPAALGRRVDTRAGLSVVFGHLEAGHAPNVIPQRALLEGTMRCQDRAAWEAAGALVPEVARAVASPYGASVEVEVRRGSPPVENDPALTARVAARLTEVLGADAVVPTSQSVGGEDFAWLCEGRPGCYLRVGVRPPGGAEVDLHSPTFDVDPAAVPFAAHALALAAAAALSG